MSKPAIEKWWKWPTFTKHVLNIVFDKGHCIKEWADFCNEYLHVRDLCSLVTNMIPFYVASVTLLDYMILEIANTLHLCPEKTHYLLQSNDQPDIHLTVCTMGFAANSFQDLKFLIPQNYQKDDPRPPKFLVFFNKIKDMEDAWAKLWACLPPSEHHRLVYFHLMMTQAYWVEEIEALKNGDIWGIFCMDACGMVSSTSRYQYTMMIAY